jgi:hypothetical protein
VETYAEIFRSNIDFFATHADILFEHRFEMADELAHWRLRYGRLEEFLNRHPRLVGLIRRMKRKIWS